MKVRAAIIRQRMAVQEEIDRTAREEDIIQHEIEQHRVEQKKNIDQIQQSGGQHGPAQHKTSGDGEVSGRPGSAKNDTVGMNAALG